MADDTCEWAWHWLDQCYNQECQSNRVVEELPVDGFCPFCGKKIKIVPEVPMFSRYTPT